MEAAERARALAAASASASSLGLVVDEAVVLQDSNRLTVRLLPCDTVARVTSTAHRVAAFELELVRRLAEDGSPVAAPEPRVPARMHERDGLGVTLWAHHETADPSVPEPAAYADALARLHDGLRRVDLPAPHYAGRVQQALALLADRELTPDLDDAGRELLTRTLRGLPRVIDGAGRDEQLLHGEPHPGNVLTTAEGPLFIDLETCCRGPVEFDVAHAPDAVADHYPGLDPDVLRACRVLTLALATTWRWDRDDRLPGGRQLGLEWLARIRSMV
ncbi:phosphotransferase enzyme family protein [Kineococcus rubinsiae]|uniref:phosphotransferase enzyme family protein n=1 Tax=Kineococcus rubinsiae TaxID=2609562 RepID=UPI001431D7EA|nr:phosphotransferase [Kineococcus rubinsiae]NIZ91906.1 phosphotransferase [Kineococcus rubinsiae]